MYIAQELRKKNIAEYLLYMWQVEDTIRAFGCSMARIRREYIDRFDYTEEQKEEEADFRPVMDGFGAGQMEQAELRPHDKTGDDIAENQRLLERFGNKGEKTGRNQDNGQVFDEIQFFCHANQ
jgi:hypothetical protein